MDTIVVTANGRDERYWIVESDHLDQIKNPSRNHAYILPDDSIWVLSYQGNTFVRLNVNSFDENTQIKFSVPSLQEELLSGDTAVTLFGKIKRVITDLKRICFSGAACDVSYNNTSSGMFAEDIQTAIDEQKVNINNLDAKIKTGWLAHGTDLTMLGRGIHVLSGTPQRIPLQGLPEGFNEYGTYIIADSENYKAISYLGVLGNHAVFSTNYQKWIVHNPEEKLDAAAIQSGIQLLDINMVNTPIDFNITFPKAFSGIPNVVFTPRHNSTVTSISHKIKTVSNTGFSGLISSSGGGTHVIEWIAVKK